MHIVQCIIHENILSHDQGMPLLHSIGTVFSSFGVNILFCLSYLISLYASSYHPSLQLIALDRKAHPRILTDSYEFLLDIKTRYDMILYF